MSRSSPSSGTSDKAQANLYPVRVRDLLKVRAVWSFPLILASLFVVVMTVFYLSAVVNPVKHLHNLPVAVVNEDHGVMLGTKQIDLGQRLGAGLAASPALSGRLKLTASNLHDAEQGMDRGSYYATVMIPRHLTRQLLAFSGLSTGSTVTRLPTIEILTNQRAGTVGVSLATGFLQPALVIASHDIGHRLLAIAPTTPATRVGLDNPINVTTVAYRPLPANSALGLSAFYVSLLTLMIGFIGGTIVNSSVDAALGYATSEIGPHWRQRPPLAITRWRTLLIKWTLVGVLTCVVSALMLLIAIGVVGLDVPDPALLWAFVWLCSASVGAGTIVLFAVIGTPGQLIAVLLFVYAGLASAGGTVPLEALPTPVRWLSYIEPMRQILAGTRAVMYFGAQADAGLTRGVVAATLGLVFWVILGTAVVRSYDRRGLHRMAPELLTYVTNAIKSYQEQGQDKTVEEAGSKKMPRLA